MPRNRQSAIPRRQRRVFSLLALEGDSRVKAAAVGLIEVIITPAPSPVRSNPTEKGAKMPTKPIPG